MSRRNYQSRTNRVISNRQSYTPRVSKHFTEFFPKGPGSVVIVRDGMSIEFAVPSLRGYLQMFLRRRKSGVETGWFVKAYDGYAQEYTIKAAMRKARKQYS